MAVVLLNGTLNRVMIVELGVPTWLVALMVSLPLVFAPFRALIGFRSDTHRSVLGWRRVPYIWFGTLLQFGGLAIMPFALLVLSGDSTRPGHRSASRARRSPSCWSAPACTPPRPPAWRWPPTWHRRESRPRVVALLYVMLLVGMVASALVFGALLADFGQVKLIQVIQGAALVTMVLNLIALWKQEAREPVAHRPRPRRGPAFGESWRAFIARRPVEPAPGRGRARHRRLQHAGHPARALWRPDPASVGGGDDGADRPPRRRRARRLRARRPRARPRRRPPPPRRAAAPLAGLVAFPP